MLIYKLFGFKSFEVDFGPFLVVKFVGRIPSFVGIKIKILINFCPNDPIILPFTLISHGESESGPERIF